MKGWGMGKMDEDEEGKMSGKMVRLFGRRWRPAMSRPTAADAREDLPASSFRGACWEPKKRSKDGKAKRDVYVDSTVKNWPR
jgi:hypothetical protein